MFLPPLGSLEMFGARMGIAFLHSPQILVQALKGISWYKRSYLGELRYLASNTFFHQADSPLMSLQTILPPKATFKNFGDLIPNPPCSWGWITGFQFMRLYFFLSVFPPCQRKWPRMASTLWWKLAGACRSMNWYKGNEERPNFRRIRRPARLSQKEPHYCTFLFILSMMVSHTSAFKDPTLIGMPR